MPCDGSSISRTAPGMAWSNEGHPQCESNLVALSNSCAPHARQVYIPGVLVLTYSPVHGASVPAWRSTRYSAGDRRTRHSSSVFGSSSMRSTVDRVQQGGHYQVRNTGKVW